MPLSRNQVDQAGRRLRAAAREGRELEERDLDVLRAFRAERREALVGVQASVKELHDSLVRHVGSTASVARGREVASRPKTEEAIVAKLRRSETSLWRMQDIVGARLVVPTLQIQDVAHDVLIRVAGRLGSAARNKDTRESGDELGYRAVHVVLDWRGTPAEIQLRTRAQQLWAQLVERFDTAAGTDLKHGVGPADQLDWLRTLSLELRNVDLGLPYTIPDPP